MKKALFLATSLLIGVVGISQTTITLQPDAAEGKDALLGNNGPAGYPSTNFGNHQTMASMAWTALGSNSDYRALIEFDLSSIPLGSIITDARLSLYWDPSSSLDGHSNLSGLNTTLIQRVTTDWEESVVTWNTQPSVTSVNEVTIPATTSDTQDNLDIDVTALVQDLVDMPEEGFGFRLSLENETYYRSQLYCSSDHADASRHPKLVVTYTEPGGGVEGDGNCLMFDGVEDYVDLGAAAGNQIRTIEMWFEPGVILDNTLDTPTPLMVRNNAFEEDEFGLYFESIGSSGDEGRLMFFRNIGGASYSIGSNSNSWNAGEWYHVAAVIDPTEGMKMFINGILQSDTDPSINPTAISSDMLALATWGDIFTRYFEGRIDDVHLSGDALYSSNFAVPCPDREVESSTVGLWLFNGSGSTALDEGGYGYDGDIYSAERDSANICEGEVNGVVEHPGSLEFELFPNPATDYLYLVFENSTAHTFQLRDLLGRVVVATESTNKQVKLSLEGLPKGTYILNVGDGTTSESRKVIKL